MLRIAKLTEEICCQHMLNAWLPLFGRVINVFLVNPHKGISGPHSYKLVHTYISPAVTIWRSESSKISLVALDKLLFIVAPLVIIYLSLK